MTVSPALSVGEFAQQRDLQTSVKQSIQQIWGVLILKTMKPRLPLGAAFNQPKARLLFRDPEMEVSPFGGHDYKLTNGGKLNGQTVGF